jgi:multicomponent Na+:H+ antiporter subunit B
MKAASSAKKMILPILFTLSLLVLFIWFIPSGEPNTVLKDRYVSMFSIEIGGENAVTAIYLGYRVYDTLFEALMLLVSIVAIIHLSWYKDLSDLPEERLNETNDSIIIYTTIRLICPVLILFGIYLSMNGHITPGGGFQGGAAVAAFFVCRYIIYDIYDIRIGSIMTVEKLIYAGIIMLAAFFIFIGAYDYFQIPQNIYLIIMNLFIGMKVSCGFLIIFYRFVALERK